MVNNGWFRKYDYQGPYFHGLTAATKASQKNPLMATVDVTNESATAGSDSGYSSNTSTSQTQATTSTGECSLFAENIRKGRVNGLIANNLNELKIDIANGKGVYTKALSEIILCRGDQEKEVSQLLRAQYSELFSQKENLGNRIFERVMNQMGSTSSCYI